MSKFVVAIGGTSRPNSSTERSLQQRLSAVERQGGRTQLFAGVDIDLPMYNPDPPQRSEKARALVTALRAWPTPLGVAINSANKIWGESGELVDCTVSGQLDMLAAQLLAGASRR